jgi:hypothetical protein
LITPEYRQLGDSRPADFCGHAGIEGKIECCSPLLNMIWSQACFSSASQNPSDSDPRRL